MTTSEKIIKYISQKGQASGKELTEYIGDISGRAVRKQLKKLLDKGILAKVGTPPKVFYFLKDKQKPGVTDISIDENIRAYIDIHYLYISPTGKQKGGWEGFVSWCRKTNQNISNTAKQYVKTHQKYQKYRTSGLIDGMPKIKATFKEVFLDQVFYLDFYSIERFGKTKLGQMLLYAKQSQNKKLIAMLVDEIRPQINQLIQTHHIDSVLFVPPTVKREVQFMKELEKNLQLPQATVNVVKVRTEIIIPQKTLSKLADRIENAMKTIVVNDKKTYHNMLLIDDAVGSGATMNEVAKQIKRRGLARGKIIGLAITGSLKGFDVISEV